MHHHYIPQFFLRAWTIGSSDGKIEVFRLDFNELASSRRTPRHTGYDDDLYALTKEKVAGLDKQVLETKFLRHIDQRASLIHQQFVEKSAYPLSRAERIAWAKFLASLRFRQPDIVQRFRTESSSELLHALDKDPNEYKSFATSEDPEKFSAWVEKNYPGLIENFGIPIISSTINDPDILIGTLRMEWAVWEISHASQEFLLADNPLIRIKFSNETIVLALPIAPTKLFVGAPTEKILYNMQQGGSKRLLGILNEFSFRQARTRIYARTNAPRRFLENRFRQRRVRP